MAFRSAVCMRFRSLFRTTFIALKKRSTAPLECGRVRTSRAKVAKSLNGLISEPGSKLYSSTSNQNFSGFLSSLNFSSISSRSRSSHWSIISPDFSDRAPLRSSTNGRMFRRDPRSRALDGANSVISSRTSRFLGRRLCNWSTKSQRNWRHLKKTFRTICNPASVVSFPSLHHVIRHICNTGSLLNYW